MLMGIKENERGWSVIHWLVEKHMFLFHDLGEEHQVRKANYTRLRYP